MARIRFENISKTFGQHTAVEDLDLDIADGEFFVLLGPTGAGKTTTLRMIAGLEKPTVGAHLHQRGRRQRLGPGRARRGAGAAAIFALSAPHRARQPRLPAPLARPQPDARPTSKSASTTPRKTLRIGHLLDRKTDRLSGGEMQRVSIGRAIVREPQVFLMDEPLSALDAKLREALRSELKDLQMRLGATFIFVTHDQVEAMTMGDRIARAQPRPDRPGRHPAGGLLQPARHVRRELCRLARHQPAPWPRRRQRRRRDAHDLRAAARRAAALARAPTPSASAPRTSASNPARRSKAASTTSKTTASKRSSPCASANNFVRASVPARVEVAVEDTAPLRLEPRQGHALRRQDRREPAPQGRVTARIGRGRRDPPLEAGRVTQHPSGRGGAVIGTLSRRDYLGRRTTWQTTTPNSTTPPGPASSARARRTASRSSRSIPC